MNSQGLSPGTHFLSKAAPPRKLNSKQHQKLETKHSNTGDYREHCHSNHHDYTSTPKNEYTTCPHLISIKEPKRRNRLKGPNFTQSHTTTRQQNKDQNCGSYEYKTLFTKCVYVCVTYACSWRTDSRVYVCVWRSKIDFRLSP